MIERPRTGLISQILPKTLAGLALWLLAFAAGMAASGIALFAFYQYRVASLEQRLLGFNEQFQEEFEERTNEFKDIVEGAQADIERAAGGIGARTAEMSELLEKVGPAIAHIRGIDSGREESSGTGFTVSSTEGQTWILTSFDLVAGSVSQGTPIRVRLGNADREARVYSWDEPRDLALVILPVGGQPVLEWAKENPDIGVQVWAIASAPGEFGASAAEGNVLDVTASGLLTDADVPRHSAGGPLIARDGRVFGLLSLAYAPEGWPPSNGWAVPIRFACQKVLRCPET